MNYSRKITFTALLVTTILWLPGIAVAADQDKTAGPLNTIEAFNNAINSRNVDGIIAQLAKGGVQLSLRPAHPGMPAEMPLTSDIQGTWRTVGAVLFSTTESYTRDVKVTDTVVSGDLATVWADATTTTVRKAGDEPMVLDFTEVYLLVKKNGLWKIGAYADNRAPDTIVIDSNE